MALKNKWLILLFMGSFLAGELKAAVGGEDEALEGRKRSMVYSIPVTDSFRLEIVRDKGKLDISRDVPSGMGVQYDTFCTGIAEHPECVLEYAQARILDGDVIDWSSIRKIKGPTNFTVGLGPMVEFSNVYLGDVILDFPHGYSFRGKRVSFKNIFFLSLQPEHKVEIFPPPTLVTSGLSKIELAGFNVQQAYLRGEVDFERNRTILEGFGIRKITVFWEEK